MKYSLQWLLKSEYYWSDGEKLLSRGWKVWKFQHKEDYHHKTEILKNRPCKFNWIEISEDGIITVKGTYRKGYLWDGCSLKFNAFNFTFGVKDGKTINFGDFDYKPYTYYASMVHDVLYQYKEYLPVTRKEADLIFYYELKKRKFFWARLYYIGVRVFGSIFGEWKYKSTKEIEDYYKSNSETVV